MYLRICPYLEIIPGRVINCSAVILEEGEPMADRDHVMKVVAVISEAQRGSPFSRAFRESRALLIPWLLSSGLQNYEAVKFSCAKSSGL